LRCVGEMLLADTRRVRLRPASAFQHQQDLVKLRSACTSYLVFKEPETRLRACGRFVETPPIGESRRVQGNLLRLLATDLPVNPYFVVRAENLREIAAG
jgi:hypothetical protein